MLDEPPSCIATPLRLPACLDPCSMADSAPATPAKDAVIWGVTAAGRAFRPSDWAERLAGLTSAFGFERKLAYSPLVRPMTVDAGALANARVLEPPTLRPVVARSESREPT